MEELQEADVLWPETPPPSRGLPALVLRDAAATVFSRGSFGEPVSSPSWSTSTALTCGRCGRCDGSVSGDASTFAGVDEGVHQAEEFQEADVLWPDDVDAGTANDQQPDVDDVGEFWWLCRDFGDAGSHMETEQEEETAAAARGREVDHDSRSGRLSSPRTREANGGVQEADVLWPDHHHHASRDGGGHGRQQQQQQQQHREGGSSSSSAPVGIPVMRTPTAQRDEASSWAARRHGCTAPAAAFVPPHEVAAARAQRCSEERAAFSVCVGHGRTLKGRDLRSVRTAVLRMTGFLET
ncbi:hypothetical protein GUJ93_ZPchr0005g14267 [Zizania palustris]|uniref:Uncharacterized protein n=1 Tax=Zizania palustris TaxID=103762 RepID=A0A8J5SGA3_ZIZPA|nr:hypothetical protein GUJ93_ZPchr0005g14267 [Zizania palustris]